MKNSRFRHSFRENASLLHKAIGEALRSGPFQGYKIYQEYPVDRISGNPKHSRLHYDWVVLDLKLIIEAHGQQHYNPVIWSKKAAGGALQRFRDLRVRDLLKKNLAIDNGYSFIEIPYLDIDKISSEYILDLHASFLEDYVTSSKTVIEKVKKLRKINLNREKSSERAKYNREQYKRIKEWKDSLKKEEEK